ncbi:hypothetical protein A3I56_00400 [Candidatus Roizmanbacteria bacterium RIFCSPLOWO2_02_FULL_43_10]|uniref:Uncharacterized protein n=3 Tax=Candidatus Roizmaniibacteriota TaxID=1752723 RepID=A0A1F7K1M9_9BACT|nr:MAG: hypothetical protein A3D08_00295 [Candidatus Roizmanbacteria bacterium RIFCSPHIGHO2_02_FULL_43_11]OGK37936.1 MAG: hypothetical protein A3F32_02115 [Candidatus Roizmanbacteria bacterium RIFCSPHIGHO2_12_FULL_42_10]OGK61774.1 MAG: hypothetical protein A3I56_00400 [Candidatus Roizmanbacteria bacterium RIFCSPLOWO2_02_FULL_43_10]
MGFEFNEQQKELIKEYRELIAFGYKKISQIDLNFNKVRVRKRVLYFMMGAMQSYSESILKLMGSEPAYEKSGESLLRSQFEISLNMRFIYSSRSEDKARLFLSDLVMQSTTFAKKHKELWKKYPKWDLEFGTIKKSDDWDKFISDNLNLLKRHQNKHKDKKVILMPNLYDRTLAIDKYLKKLGKLSEKNSAEKFYIIYYSYFSQSTHQNISGLLRFMRGRGDIFKDPFFDIDSKPEDAERVLLISYQLYFATLHFFLQVFNVYDSKEYEHFKQYSRKILKG